MNGLRPSEVVESVRLINSKEAFQTYYKPERNTVEHYRFSSIFLRQTKKVNISLVGPEIIDVSKAVGICNVSYNAIRLACWKRGITCDMRFCRKVFASCLRQCRIESEIVDLLLQGRVPKMVFARHYFASLKYRDRVLECLYELKLEIER